MISESWLLYGAAGYTGRLVAEEAVRRGHRPILAGRSAEKLAQLADRLGLPHVVVGLDDDDALTRVVAHSRLVFHAAGPFTKTSDPMVRACLRTGVHYVDITGEIEVFESNWARQEDALRAGIVLMSGVGFDVVPTDCAARFVADRVPDARQLSIGVAIVGGTSGGTLKTVIESLPGGVIVRRDGKLTNVSAGRGVRNIPFADRDRAAIPMSWGDVSTAYRTTEVPNITVYMATSRRAAWSLRVFHPMLARMLAIDWIRRSLQGIIGTLVRGPSIDTLSSTTTQVWAHAENERGDSHEVWVEAEGSYPFTAHAGVRIVERILGGMTPGVTTPALAFGADFVLEVPGTRRYDNQRPPRAKTQGGTGLARA